MAQPPSPVAVTPPRPLTPSLIAVAEKPGPAATTTTYAGDFAARIAAAPDQPYIAVGVPVRQAARGRAGAQPGYSDIFHGHTNVLVKQRWEVLECMGCEARNRYDVGPPARDGGIVAGAQMVHVSEESACCERICCGPNRELTLLAHSGPTAAAPVALRMHKPCHWQGAGIWGGFGACFVCCCNIGRLMAPFGPLHPALAVPLAVTGGALAGVVVGMGGCCAGCRPRVALSDGEGRPVGAVWDPFRCCAVDQHIYDAGGALRFTLGPETCLQMGFCVPCCADVRFPIRSAESGAQVAQLVKKSLTCGECCLKTNRFEVDFQQVTDPTDRMLIFGATMLLDLQYFEIQK